MLQTGRLPVLAEPASGHTAGTVTEGEEADKTILSLPDATGKEIAFLSTAAGSRQGGAAGPQPLPGSGWPQAPPPAHSPPTKHAPSVSWLCDPSSKPCSDFCS